MQLDLNYTTSPSHTCAGESDGEEVWEDCDGELSYEDTNFEFEPAAIPPSIPETISTESRSQRTLVKWLVGFLIQLQARHYVPDSALNRLLKFLHTFFCVLGRFSGFIAAMVTHFPATLYQLKKTLPFAHQFKQFVVCPKCWKIYHYGECVVSSGSHKSSKGCNHVRYPNHPYPSGRRECGHHLLKSVSLLSGKKLLYPFKLYCYKSLQSSLQELLLLPGFHESCQHWRSRNTSERLSDVYDGKVWNTFLTISEEPFLECPFNLALMLNIDWFQPYKHTISSVGAIYLTIMNLPRALRFKRNNVILLALIPGPSEPKHDINTLLEPLVKELTKLWAGIMMEVHDGTSVVKRVVRGALLCCACDLPAGRKVCGFLGHSASLGCSKCMKSFKGSVGSMNFSGFDRPTWPLRTNYLHRQNVQLVQQCKTNTEQKRKESQLGCRYSVLLQLPYFDPPQMLIIDPMHNLFLGSGKHMLNIWLQNNLLSPSQFQQVQECVDRFVVPTDVCRIPHRILTGFSGFTADQFKNWITNFSIPALFQILTGEHLECWRHFVLACRILCKHSLSFDDISLADALLMRFCRRVQHLYGESAVTPNMHMHAHIREDLLNYGPVYGFWLFSFERYNGILGNQPTNNKLPEPQLMRRFIDDNSAGYFPFPDEFKEEFSSLCMTEAKVTGSVSDTIVDFRDAPTYTLPSRSKYSTLDEQDREYLSTLFLKLNPSSTCASVSNAVFHKYTCISRNGRMISSSSSRRTTSSPFIAMAEWDYNLYGPPPTPLTDPTHPSSRLRPVKIQHFSKVSINIGEHVQYLVIARVSWYQPHPYQHKVGKPAEVWCPNLFECHGLHSFIPIEKIVSRCVYCEKNIQNEPVIIIVPLVE